MPNRIFGKQCFFLLLISTFSAFGTTDDLNSTPVNEEHEIMGISLGNGRSEEEIEIYISPSCLHCGKFVVTDLEDFVKEHGEKYKIKISFLPASAKDVFIMKLIQHEAGNDESSYFSIYKKYIKRTLATINHIKPTEEQEKLYKGSNSDPEMIKFQVEASNFGFSDKKIVDAYPDPEMKAPFESAIMMEYAKQAKAISKIINSKELDLPLIVKGGKSYKKLKDVLDN